MSDNLKKQIIDKKLINGKLNNVKKLENIEMSIKSP